VFFHPKEEVTFSGQIESKDALIGSKIGGRVEKILKDEGVFVKKGETVLVFDANESVLRLNLAKAKVVGLEASLLKLKNGYQDEEVDMAKSDLDAIKPALENAKTNLDRQEVLFKNSVSSKKDYDDAKAQYLQTVSQRDSLLKRYELMKKGSREEDIKVAIASLAEARENVKLAQIELDETRLLSPMDGRIEKVAVQVGDLVSKNQPIATISARSEKYAKFYVPETKLSLVKVGQKCELTIDGSSKRYPTEIFFIAQSAEFTPKNVSTKDDRDNLLYAVKAKISDDELKNGMIIEVKLQ
jgi:HlyD family secretion protein